MKRRFTVSRHDSPSGAHFDFFVERGEKLASWRLAAPLPPSGVVSAERAPDHRPLYLDFEGEISGGRGTVKIVERGVLEDREGDPDSEEWELAIGDRVLRVLSRR